MRARTMTLVLAPILSAAACGGGGPAADELTPVYVSWYSHNEEGSYWENLVTDREAYLAYRQDLVDRVSLLHRHGVRLNWESDHSVLRAMLEHEQGDVLDETGGKNMLQWMVEDMGMVVDPHGHLTEYNHADLALLIGRLGVDPSGVVGGFALLECGDERGTFDTTDWQATIGLDQDGLIRGRKFPDASWRPRVLAQPAMRGHALDEFSAGVWTPDTEGAFTEHRPDAELVHVGQGYPHDVLNLGESNSGGTKILYREAGYIRELADEIASGELPAGRIYTASIHLRDQPRLPGVTSTLEGVRQTLEALDDLVRDGRVVFADYEGVAALWREQFGSEPNRVGIERFSIYPELMETVDAYCWGRN